MTPAELAGRGELASAALAASGTGVWLWDTTSGIVQWDATMEALCGRAPGTFDGTFDAWLSAVHPDERSAVAASIDRAVADRSACAVEHRVVWPDGTERWLECRGQALTGAAGEPTGAVGCAFDITERKAAEVAVGRSLTKTRLSRDRLAGLQRLSRRLAEAASVDGIVAAVFDVLETPVPTASRAVWLLDATAEGLELVAQVGLAPDAAARFAVIDLAAPLPGAIACRERRTIVVPPDGDAVAAFPALDGVPRSSPGFVAVPLCTESTAIGVLALGYTGELDDDDLVFVETAAGQVALALARTMLTDALAHRAEDAADAARAAAAAAERERRARQHFEFLTSVAQVVMRSASDEELMASVAQVTVPMLGDWCTVHFRPEPGAPLQVAGAHRDPARAEWMRHLVDAFPYDPTGRHGVARVLATGTTEFAPRPDGARVARTLADDPDAWGADAAGDTVRSILTVPLTSQNRTVGALQYVRTRDEVLPNEDEVALAEDVGSRIGDALMLRWQAGQHREIATTLQRAFLPPHLPDVAGFDLAARYLPAGEAAEVGGDFYDVFLLEDGCWAVLIGDVCGTGADAAATAAIVRHTVRAAARHGHDLASIVEWANHAVLHSGRDLFCTMCFATIELADDAPPVLRVVSAGHPLPILRRASGVTQLGGHGTLLGVFEHIDIITETVQLAAGDAAVVYTDGVSDLPPPHGVPAEHLVELVDASSPQDSVDVLVDAVLDDLGRRTSAAVPRDDVALLGLRYRRGPAIVDERPLVRTWQRSFPAEHTSIRAARRFARDLLADTDVDAGTLELAVSELVSNAVLHARTRCTVRVEQHRDSVRVEVADQDPRPPRRLLDDPDRITGRGLRIVDAIVDRWDVETAPEGKTVWFELAVRSEDAA